MAVLESDLIEETLIKIHVDTTVSPPRLEMYPQRADESEVYVVGAGRVGSPVKPHRVRWLVQGLASDCTLELIPSGSNAQPHGLGHVTFQGTANPAAVLTQASTSACGAPGHGHLASWKYDVVLSQNGKQVARLDPTIIIKEDP